jgi:hypothetical protein
MDSQVEKVQKRTTDAPDVQVFGSLKWIIKEIGPNINQHIKYVSKIFFTPFDPNPQTLTLIHWLDCSHYHWNISTIEWTKHRD